MEILGIFPKELSKDFHKLFEMRQISDYKTLEEITSEQAEDMINRAGSFVDAVTKYIESVN